MKPINPESQIELDLTTPEIKVISQPNLFEKDGYIGCFFKATINDKPTKINVIKKPDKFEILTPADCSTEIQKQIIEIIRNAIHNYNIDKNPFSECPDCGIKHDTRFKCSEFEL
jgi:hypothetical protein